MDLILSIQLKSDHIEYPLYHKKLSSLMTIFCAKRYGKCPAETRAIFIETGRNRAYLTDREKWVREGAKLDGDTK